MNKRDSTGNNGNGAPAYNMKAVVTQTGLNPATIRAWERRYGFPTPNRTSGGHRQYSQSDIDALKWLVVRQEEGISISHAIDLWRSLLADGEDPHKHEGQIPGRTPTAVKPALVGEHIDQIRQAWISACLALDREGAEQILAAAFAQFAPETVCFQILQYGLSEIGHGWYRGDVTVHQEHFASAITNQRLEMLIAASPPPTRHERIIVFSAPGDYHVFSPLLLTYLMRQEGFDVVYLGADVPVEELESTIENVKPDLVVVTAQLLTTAAGLKDISSTLQQKGILLAYGGLAFSQIPSLRQLISGHFLGEKLEGAVERATGLIAERPPVPTPMTPPESYRKALEQYRQRRALVESHVWGTFIATNKSTSHLSQINQDIGQVIEAALRFGDLDLLHTDINWIEYLLIGYRPPKSWIIDYLEAYHQAARIHLGDSASMITDWFAQILQE